MALTTYSELLASIEDWLNRVGSPEVAARASDFIALAEARHNRELRARQMVKRATAPLDAGFITLPGDWLEAKQVQLNIDGRPRRLEYVTLEHADDVRASFNYDEVQPRFFNVTGGQLEVVPTVKGEAEIEMTYFARIPALSDSNASNWLLQQWPDLYLYGALVHSAPYLRDDERVMTWAGMYDRALAEIKLADERAVYSGSTLKTRARLRN
jgi:hypothetical protein